MDLDLSTNLKTAISAWVSEAVQHFKDDQLSQLRKCMAGDGDVRIVYSVRRNAVVIETMDFADQMVAEVFREELVPWLGGFAVPGLDKL